MLKLTLSCVALLLSWIAGYGLSLIIALPPALLGLFVLFAVLTFLGHVPEALFDLCQFLLRHFSLFFIPPIIAAWVYVKTLHQELWLFLLAILLSTFLSMLITSWLGRRLLPEEKSQDKANTESDNNA